MEGRMTLCNMTIEAGARAGMIAADQVTIDYLRGRPRAPKGPAFERAAAQWRKFFTDPDAHFDFHVDIDASSVRPTITYGTDPGMSVKIGEPLPIPTSESQQKALDYMDFQGGQYLNERKVDLVFVGSCTNGRLSDMRAAAGVLKGNQIASHVRMLVVPGSEHVRWQAEAENLHRIFESAGAEWRLPGCSMCLAMNGDIVPPGKTAVSTSNRNFEGRQGAGSRTLLASPETAAACAVLGHVGRAVDLENVKEVT
jgi:3-isopropylmalate/(R)-2-methylmalate dehydratase large subunit